MRIPSYLKSSFYIVAGLAVVGLAKLLHSEQDAEPDPRLAGTKLSTPVSKHFGQISDSLGKTLVVSKLDGKDNLWSAALFSLELDKSFHGVRVFDSTLFEAQPMSSLIEALDGFFADQEIDPDYIKQYRDGLRPKLDNISKGLPPAPDKFAVPDFIP